MSSRPCDLRRRDVNPRTPPDGGRGCDYCATACRLLVVGWTHCAHDALPLPSSLGAVKRRAGYVVRKLLSGSRDGLRATSTISNFIRGSNLLAVPGVSLAQTCRAGRRAQYMVQRKRRSRRNALSVFGPSLRTRNKTRQGQCGCAEIGGASRRLGPKIREGDRVVRKCLWVLKDCGATATTFIFLYFFNQHHIAERFACSDRQTHPTDSGALHEYQLATA